MADQLRVRQWLVQLGRLTTAKLSAGEATDWLDVTAPCLASRFADHAFTPQSLEHVAACCKFLPAYGELVELVREWVSKNPPPAARLTHDQFAVRDWAVHEREQSWHGIDAEEVRAKVRALDGHRMRLVWGKSLAAALNRSAPHHLGWLPPEFLADLPQPAADVLPIRPPPGAAD